MDEYLHQEDELSQPHLCHFEYLVIPFGLSNVPSVFQSLVNNVLQDFINRFVFVYMLIFLKSAQEHETHARQVLQCLLGNKLFVNRKKYEFHIDTASFLCYRVEKGNLKPEPAKVR